MSSGPEDSVRFRRKPLAMCLSTVLLAGHIAWADGALAVRRPFLSGTPGTAEPRWLGPHPWWGRTQQAGSAPGAVPAGSVPVTSCDDDGSAGTLRSVIASAVSGDAIDLTQLACSSISLQTGAIEVDVDDLTLLGPGANALSIGAGFASRVFHHTGSGTLTVDALAIVDGLYYNSTPGIDAKGGCIYSAGSVSATNAVVFHCYAFNSVTYMGLAAGGGIFASSTVSIDNSYVANNLAAGFLGRGGGVSANQFTANNSYIGSYFLGNNTYSSGPQGPFRPSPGGGGGAVYTGSATITDSFFIGNTSLRFAQPGGALMLTSGHSTISGSTFFRNQGGGYGGAIYIPSRRRYQGSYVYCGDTTVTISNSTVASNFAQAAGGIYSGCQLSMSNTTVAFNAATGFLTARGGGLVIGGDTELNSTIIAQNRGVGAHPDLDASGNFVPGSFTGRSNLIARPNVAVPRDTIVLVDAMLAPLALNGGMWPTLALLPGSPAIDAGNNNDHLPFDQRGPGYPRVSGARADIGAYEVQASRVDVVFGASFE